MPEAQAIGIGNLVMNQTFYGGIDEEWFFLIPIAMEARGGEIITAMGRYLHSGEPTNVL